MTTHPKTEAETRADLIDPMLNDCGWKNGETDVIVRREFPISKGRILTGGKRGPTLSADYLLLYKNVKLGVIEAKKSSRSYTDGVAQAKKYAELLNVRFTFATNGKTIYQIDMQNGSEHEIERYPTPDELWNMTYVTNNDIFNKLSAIPFNMDGGFQQRYYQENAVNAVIKALSMGKKRILLTLATGTGKTKIAYQIVWKLMQARWNLRNIGDRLPRILFLTDRNILANQAYDAFTGFPNGACARIKPEQIKKDGKVPQSQSIFFTIFQTFMSGEEPYFGQYPKDFFDFIIIDECHRGGANDESNWRKILEYFDSAVHLGLTATPKRKDNVDTYKYFGEPVYTYSLKQAIDDGYLTPFRVRRITDNFGTYEYNPQDIIDGEIDKDKIYKEPDFNKNIELREREAKRVKKFMDEINQNDKTLVFCATQRHAGVIRDIINQVKTVSTNPNYCVRVTADDGETGEMFLRQFQDTEKTIPTILTTSQKLSTGVDAIQIKNIVLLRPVNSMIEFKQIIGRGTRLCDGKEYFTVYDFVNASKNFEDQEWDGPIEYVGKPNKNKPKGQRSPEGDNDENTTNEPIEQKEPVQIKLGGGRSVEITDNGTSFYDNASGRPISAKEFIERLIGNAPNFFKTEEELRTVWSDPITRKELLTRMAERGYTEEAFDKIKHLLNADNSDIFDVLQYIVYSNQISDIMSRQERVNKHKILIFDNYNSRQNAFIEFVLRQYINNGVSELSDERIGDLVNLKYGSPANAQLELGKTSEIRRVFCDFQQYLYKKAA